MNFFLGLCYLTFIIPLLVSSTLLLTENSMIFSCSDCKEFQDGNTNYSYFNTIYDEGNTPFVLIGVRDGVLNVTLDAQLMHFISIPSIPYDHYICQRNVELGNWPPPCGNMISAIYPILHFDLILVCGTNSRRSQICWKLNGTKVGSTSSSYSFFKIPLRKYVISDPYIYQAYSVKNLHRTTFTQTWVFTKDGLHETRPKELVLRNTDAEIVSLYEIGNYVYFFFHETSEENIDELTKETVSRVARICKHDPGGGGAARSILLTFSKVRLLCPVPRADGFHDLYNILEMTAVIHDDRKTYIYGLFRARINSDEFVLCRYLLSDIDKAFDSKVYYNIDPKVHYKKFEFVVADKRDYRHLTCDSSLVEPKLTAQEYKDYRMRLIHASVIRPVDEEALILRRHRRFFTLLAESVVIADVSYHVLRLFDSNLLFEIFVNSTGVVSISARKINKDHLIIKDIKLIKYNQSSSRVVTPPATPTISATTTIPTTPTTSATATIPTTRTTSATTTIPTAPTTSATPTTPTTLSSSQPPTTIIPANKTSTVSSNLTLNTNTSVTKLNSTIEKRESERSNLNLTSTHTTVVERTSTDSQEMFTSRETIVVATEKKLVFVPIASCTSLKTCRECISVTNPYCAWHSGTCIQLNSTSKRPYLQDLENGDYSKICPQIPVSCVVSLESKIVVNEEVILRCSLSGLPTPKISSWFKDETVVDNNTVTVNDQMLTIKSYSLKSSGKYMCQVTNDVTSYNCSLTLFGSLPKVHCKWDNVKGNFNLSCNVTGYPLPTFILLKSGERHEILHMMSEIEMKENIEYSFIAYNAFGDDVTGVYKIISTTLKFNLVEEKWHDDLKKSSSKRFIDLNIKVLQGIRELYKRFPLFQDASATFSEGSVIATVVLSGLITPDSDERNLKSLLDMVIKNKGRLGDLLIGPSDAALNGTLLYMHSSSSGVPLWLLIVLLCVTALLLLFLGCFCGARGYYRCALYQIQRKNTKESSSSDEEVAMDVMSRSEKVRESECKLLKKDERKKVKMPKRCLQMKAMIFPTVDPNMGPLK
ncbi:uncharacterized protein LOC124454642 isoform X2 [Xenia sp. Carnegie-2017]|uniref:uncharacterized protein LOC124454642 isoform X2 n=1 Tax=Xenia sp. Carnegie-2017 TaxID=2897299 RepID=UPI001F039130|nr:uncharacterized protein LOC124454642 isoform X2 [Xenia sp. Carnegie-2017]